MSISKTNMENNKPKSKEEFVHGVFESIAPKYDLDEQYSKL